MYHQPTACACVITRRKGHSLSACPIVVCSLHAFVSCAVWNERVREYPPKSLLQKGERLWGGKEKRERSRVCGILRYEIRPGVGGKVSVFFCLITCGWIFCWGSFVIFKPKLAIWVQWFLPVAWLAQPLLHDVVVFRLAWIWVCFGFQQRGIRQEIDP